MITRKWLLRHLAIFSAAIIVLAFLPYLRFYYLLFMLFLYLFYLLLSTSLNFIAGFVGLHSLGNAVFFGLGAYSFALIGKGNILYAILGNAILCIAVALVFIPMLGIRGIYFVLSTIFINEVVKLLICALKDITGGAPGIHLITPPGYSFQNVYYLTLAFSMFVVALSLIIENSRIGVYFTAIRENEEAAASLGISVVKYKLLALILSAFFTGIGGIIYGYYMLYIEPYAYFATLWSLLPLFITIVGGEGTTLGPILGTAFFVFLMEFTKGLGEWYLSIYAGILIVVMMVCPEGLVGVITRLLGRRKVTNKKR